MSLLLKSILLVSYRIGTLKIRFIYIYIYIYGSIVLVTSEISILNGLLQYLTHINLIFLSHGL